MCFFIFSAFLFNGLFENVTKYFSVSSLVRFLSPEGFGDKRQTQNADFSSNLVFCLCIYLFIIFLLSVIVLSCMSETFVLLLLPNPGHSFKGDFCSSP